MIIESGSGDGGGNNIYIYGTDTQSQILLRHPIPDDSGSGVGALHPSITLASRLCDILINKMKPFILSNRNMSERNECIEIIQNVAEFKMTIFNTILLSIRDSVNRNNMQITKTRWLQNYNNLLIEFNNINSNDQPSIVHVEKIKSFNQKYIEIITMYERCISHI